MRILVGMSGGLDSTYAAKKLLSEGHEVEGAVLVMHDFTDVDSAKEAASALGMKLHVVDCRDMFSTVTDNFVNEYSHARTPNPCIVCNPKVKFRALLDFALASGFDKIATGHYARVEHICDAEGEKYALLRSADSKKDQTYMLYRLPQDILSYLVLPLSSDIKSEIKKAASADGLAVADRKESQEICFIPDGDYAAYIEEKVGKFPEGDFVDTDGRVIGRHNGIIRYTVGQRKGLGVSAGERVFVTDIDPVNNRIMLSPDGSYTDTVTVKDIVFSGMNEPPADTSRSVFVKLRYLAPPVEATALFDGCGNARLKLSSPQKSVTPGQSAVMYDGDLLLCGGFIE